MNCDKCGKYVDQNNDAVSLQWVLEHGCLPDDFALFHYGARHLLPVDGCEGSPSRAQYLDGQPLDTRGYAYVTERESSVRDAYKRLQELTR